MLQAIHDRVTGWIAWIIVGLIIVVFALWGVDSYLRSEAKVYAAKVNDVEISISEYRSAKQQQLQRMRAMLGEQFDSDIANAPEFKSAVLDRLVEEELLVQAATDAGLAVSDAYLAARIQSIQEFQGEDGKFSQERYQRLLSQQGLAVPVFERQVRRSLLISQFVGSITDSAIVVAQEVEQGVRLQGQQRKLQYVRIPVARHLEKVEVKPEDVAAYYDKHKARYVEPEQVRLQYLELSLADIAADMQVTDAEIEALYAEEKARLMTEEQRRARHILIKLDDDADDAAVAAARQKAEKLVKQLRDGEDFAKLAKEHSNDPGSAAEGGDLGLFGKGMMVPEFEEAAFALPKDEISDPVRSPFGFHIIQVTEIQPAKTPELADVRDQLAEQVKRRHAEQLFAERSETLGTLSFEHPDTLSVAAEQLGLKVQETGWLSAGGGEGIASHPQVMEAALGDDVLNGGNNSEVIELEPEHVAVVRVAEHKPAKQLDLDKVREAIQSDLRQEAANEAAREEGAALLKRLEQGATFASIAAENGLEVQDAGYVGRGDSKHDRQIVTEAFRVPRTEDGKVAHAGASLANGDYVLLRIEAVRDGDLSGVGEAQRTEFRRNLNQLYGTLESAALLEQLKGKAEIDREAERLD